MGKRSQSKEGAVEKCKLAEVCVYDSADVLDQEDSEWTKGWETRYKRVKVVEALKNITINVASTDYYTDGVKAAPYGEMSLMVKASAYGADVAQYVKFVPQYSDDNVSWYEDFNENETTRVSFGVLNSYGSVSPIIANYVRYRYRGVSVSAANYFILGAKMVLVT